MRILVTHSFYRVLGGEDTYVRNYVPLLRSAHAVEVLERQNAELDPGARTAARMTFSPREQQAVSDVIERFRPDVVHLHNAYPSLGPAVQLAAGKHRIPLVFTVHNFRLRCPNSFMYTEGEICRRCEGGNYLNAAIHDCFPARSQGIAYGVSLWLHRFVLRLEAKINVFIAPSAFMRDRLLSWGIPPKRVELLRHFTRIVDSSSTVGDVGLYLGRLSSEKGLDVLLKALVLAGDPPFNIIGEGPATAELRRLADDLGLQNVSFRGFLERSEFASLLHRARFLVFPSVWEENSPMAACEGLAAGRPLIVSDLGGLPELAADGRGCVVAAGDHYQLADRISWLMSDDAACRDMGSSSLSFAQNELRPERHLDGLRKIYEKAQRHA